MGLETWNQTKVGSIMLFLLLGFGLQIQPAVESRTDLLMSRAHVEISHTISKRMSRTTYETRKGCLKPKSLVKTLYLKVLESWLLFLCLSKAIQSSKMEEATPNLGKEAQGNQLKLHDVTVHVCATFSLHTYSPESSLSAHCQMNRWPGTRVASRSCTPGRLVRFIANVRLICLSSNSANQILNLKTTCSGMFWVLPKMMSCNHHTNRYHSLNKITKLHGRNIKAANVSQLIGRMSLVYDDAQSSMMCSTYFPQNMCSMFSRKRWSTTGGSSDCHNQAQGKLFDSPLQGGEVSHRPHWIAKMHSTMFTLCCMQACRHSFSWGCPFMT